MKSRKLIRRLICCSPVDVGTGESAFTLTPEIDDCYFYFDEFIRYGKKFKTISRNEIIARQEVWNRIGRRMDSRRPTYIFTPDLISFLTLSNGWEIIESGQLFFSRNLNTVLDSGGQVVDQIRVTVRQCNFDRERGTVLLTGNRGLVTISSHQTTIKLLAQSLSQQQVESSDSSAPGLSCEIQETKCPLSSHRLFASDVLGIIVGHEKYSCGSWESSPGRRALSAWREMDGRNTVRPSTSIAAKSLEERAVVGGSIRIWRQGSFGGFKTRQEFGDPCPVDFERFHVTPQLCYIDYCCLYPSIMRDKKLPVKHVKHYDNISVCDLIEFSRDFGICAKVRVRTEDAEYPVRKDNEIVYPIGLFDTYLCGPELDRALDDGIIEKVFECSVYEMGNPLINYASWACSERWRAKIEGNISWEREIKESSNSLTGKFAQRNNQWRPYPAIPSPIMWGDYIYCDNLTGELESRRAIAGITFRRSEGSRKNSLPLSVYNWIVSHGRYKMRLLREKIGYDNIILQQTDGVWVTLSASELLESYNISDSWEPGKPRVDKTARYMYVIAPNHYYTDGVWTLSGVAGGYTVSPTGIVTYRIKPPIISYGLNDRPTNDVAVLRKIDMRQISQRYLFDSRGYIRHPREDVTVRYI